jgi:hypothetical protein
VLYNFCFALPPIKWFLPFLSFSAFNGTKAIAERVSSIQLKHYFLYLYTSMANGNINFTNL